MITFYLKFTRQDKWRNLRVSAGHGSRDRSRSSRAKNNKSNAENSAPNAVPCIDSSAFAVEDDPPNSPEDELNAVRFVHVVRVCVFCVSLKLMLMVSSTSFTFVVMLCIF